MTDTTPDHLKLYNDPDYFMGEYGRRCSGYENYENCSGVLNTYADLLDRCFQPSSVLDVGAAYGFVVQWFRARAVPAFGVEPSAFARSKVHPAVQPAITAGALPDLPGLFHTEEGPLFAKLDLVTCTEVLEHVPEALVPASLQALTDRALHTVVCLIMLEGPGADGDEGHICLKSRDWWNAQFDATGFVVNAAAESWLNEHEYSRQMHWAGRFFVRTRPPVVL